MLILFSNTNSCSQQAYKLEPTYEAVKADCSSFRFNLSKQFSTTHKGLKILHITIGYTNIKSRKLSLTADSAHSFLNSISPNTVLYTCPITKDTMIDDEFKIEADAFDNKLFASINSGLHLTVNYQH